MGSDLHGPGILVYSSPLALVREVGQEQVAHHHRTLLHMTTTMSYLPTEPHPSPPTMDKQDHTTTSSSPSLLPRLTALFTTSSTTSPIPAPVSVSTLAKSTVACSNAPTTTSSASDSDAVAAAAEAVQAAAKVIQAGAYDSLVSTSAESKSNEAPAPLKVAIHPTATAGQLCHSTPSSHAGEVPVQGAPHGPAGPEPEQGPERTTLYPERNGNLAVQHMPQRDHTQGGVQAMDCPVFGCRTLLTSYPQAKDHFRWYHLEHYQELSVKGSADVAPPESEHSACIRNGMPGQPDGSCCAWGPPPGALSQSTDPFGRMSPSQVQVHANAQAQAQAQAQAHAQTQAQVHARLRSDSIPGSDGLLDRPAGLWPPPPPSSFGYYNPQLRPACMAPMLGSTPTQTTSPDRWDMLSNFSTGPSSSRTPANQAMGPSSSINPVTSPTDRRKSSSGPSRRGRRSSSSATTLMRPRTKGTYPCQFCGATVSRMDSLTRHVKRKHPVEVQAAGGNIGAGPVGIPIYPNCQRPDTPTASMGAGITASSGANTTVAASASPTDSIASTTVIGSPQAPETKFQCLLCSFTLSPLDSLVHHMKQEHDSALIE